MNRSQLLTGALALVVSATTACNRADTSREAREAADGVRTVAARAGERLADSWLTAKVQAQFFADDDVKARYIDVTSRDGTVTLRGFVESDAVRQEALQIARNTDGVKQLDDRLLIGQAPPTASNLGSTASSPSAVPSSGAVGTGGATVPDDSMITSLVQARYFVEPTIKARSIEVSTSSGIVTLRGRVASDDERAQALLLARTTQGVQRVEDGLAVDASLGQPTPATASSASTASLPSSSIAGAATAAPGAAEPAVANRSAAVGTSGARSADSTMEGAVRSKLTGDAQLKASGIEVTARDGVVMLQGTAASQAIKQRALTMARETDGVTQVVDRITVGRRR